MKIFHAISDVRHSLLMWTFEKADDFDSWFDATPIDVQYQIAASFVDRYYQEFGDQPWNAFERDDWLEENFSIEEFINTKHNHDPNSKEALYTWYMVFEGMVFLEEKYRSILDKVETLDSIMEALMRVTVELYEPTRKPSDISPDEIFSRLSYLLLK